ncbi:MAG TPA: VOC family protein [Ilumatobacteraceae bacterium]
MDAFTSLRSDHEPVAPDPAFAARLRARIVERLDRTADLPLVQLPDRRTTMPDTATTPTAAQPFTEVLIPYIAVHDAAAALSWYADGLGAVETMRYTGDDGRVGHAEISIGGAVVMLSDEYPDHGVVSPRTLGGTPFALHLSVPDVDALYARAVGAGATSMRPPEDRPYGDRSCTILDPFGHRWTISTRIAEPTAAEIEAAMGGEFTITTPDDPST